MGKIEDARESADRRAANNEWGLYRSSRFLEAEFLKEAEQYEDALLVFLEVAAVDVNGPQNLSAVSDEEIGPDREYSHFQPDADWVNVPPGVSENILELQQHLGLSIESLAGAFWDMVASRWRPELRLSPTETWIRVLAALHEREKDLL